MADDENKEESPPKKSKLILILIVVIVLLLGGGGAAALFLMGGSGGGGGSEPKEVVTAPNEIGPTLQLNSFIVNLDEPGGTRYLKVRVELELRSPLTPEESKLQVRLRDKLLVYFSGLRVQEIQKSEAKIKIKKQMVAIANKVYGGERTRRAYFNEFVIQ